MKKKMNAVADIQPAQESRVEKVDAQQTVAIKQPIMPTHPILKESGDQPGAGKLFGYIRVSSREQNEARQVVALHNFGITDDRIFLDKQSGKDFNRPAYQALLRQLNAGDVLVVKSIDRLGRNYEEIHPMADHNERPGRSHRCPGHGFVGHTAWERPDWYADRGYCSPAAQLRRGNGEGFYPTAAEGGYCSGEEQGSEVWAATASPSGRL